MTMLCERCEEPVEDEDQWCPHCGVPLFTVHYVRPSVPPNQLPVEYAWGGAILIILALVIGAFFCWWVPGVMSP